MEFPPPRSLDPSRWLGMAPAFSLRCSLLLLLTVAHLGGVPTPDATLTHAIPAVDLPAPNSPPASTVPDPANLPAPTLPLTAQFDHDGDHRLDVSERHAAREFLAQHPLPDPALIPVRPGHSPAPPLELAPSHPGPTFTPADALTFATQSAYDPHTLRTFFLEFDDADWEKELVDFARTDVLVPARLTVDGQTYPDIGVHARNLAAEQLLPPGYKRSLELTLDYAHADQQWAGQRHLQLLAGSTDPTGLRTMLYTHVARESLPAPQANFVRVVINGEFWGVYTSTQPLDDGFVQANFHTTAGARWVAVAGSHLEYLGDNPAPYRARYQLLSTDDPTAWAALVRLCKTIAQAKPGQLAADLEPLLDLDEALKFLALENLLINQDGYLGDEGIYGLYLDNTGHFHLIPQDAEHSFRLVLQSDYERTRRREPTAAEAADSSSPPRKQGKHQAPAAQKLQANSHSPDGPTPVTANDRNHFPRQSDTNLALLLSYSFINKADTDFDEQVTQQEWHEFARAWFMVMDEDLTGRLTREQFIDKMRLVISPNSMKDGHSHQSFGQEDAAGAIARDFFNALDENHDDQLTPQELNDRFDGWFHDWRDPKTKNLTQPGLYNGLSSIMTKVIFRADESYIATSPIPPLGDTDDRRHGNGGRGRHGGSGGEGGGGLGLGFGPLHVGTGSGSRRGNQEKSLVFFSEELDPLAGLDASGQPLLTNLLNEPATRKRYLAILRELSDHCLLWPKIGPLASEYHQLIASDTKRETHRVASYEQFVQAFDQNSQPGASEAEAALSLKAFVEARSTYLEKNNPLNGSGDW